MRIRIIRPAAREFRPLSPSELEEHKKEWRRFASPGTEIDVVRILKGAETIESRYDEEMAAPFILEEVKRAEKDGADGVIIHCMADPALSAARELVTIPVLGEGLACYATGLSLGEKFSILSPRPDHMRRREKLKAYGLEQYLASVRSLDIPVRDLRRDLAALKQAMREEGRRAIEDDGADVIIPGCGEIYGIAQELTEALGVPVLDPRAIVVRFAEMFIGLSLSHSKRAYPSPPEKRREI